MVSVLEISACHFKTLHSQATCHNTQRSITSVIVRQNDTSILLCISNALCDFLALYFTNFQSKVKNYYMSIIFHVIVFNFRLKIIKGQRSKIIYAFISTVLLNAYLKR